MMIVLLACSWLSLPGTLFPNLDFGAGNLTAWEGTGFRVLPSVPDNPSRTISSSDHGQAGRKALLHRAIFLPPGAGVLQCTAQAVRAAGCPPNENLDIVLMAAGRRILPKKVRTAQGWQSVATLLPGINGRPQEYIWQVAALAGQTVRIVLVDEDDRPGCHVSCSGFQLLTADEFEGKEFSQLMVRLAEEHKLCPMTRFDSPHFTALSNTDDRFSEARLRNGELIYGLFYDHFRRKGFRLHKPPAKLMVALFDTQAGFEAYLGRKMSPLVTGMYHPASNRFVMYDFGQNQAYLAQKQQAEGQVRRVRSQLDRQRFLGTLQLQAEDVRTGTNIGTIMHEVAHQLSFNSGLLNREGDVPLWLAEGLACYCEATANGVWQGIGEPNPERLRLLAAVLDKQGTLLPVRRLLESEDWIRGRTTNQTILLGYAQSWALFRMLMEEEPRTLRSYLRLIYGRQTSERRLADFQQAFGADIQRLEERHAEYVRKQVQARVRAAAR